MLVTMMMAAGLAMAPQQVHEPLDPAIEAALPATVEHAGEEDHGFDILHHIQDARYWETPFGTIDLPPAGSWMLGPVDMTPTKHVLFLGITAVLVLLLFLWAAAAASKSRGEPPARKGYNAMEALVLFFRNQVVLPNVGHGGEKFAPFIITLFFFILIANLIGLLPWGATATGNVSVTAALAVMAFVVIEVAGMRELGAMGYMKTIVFVPHGLPKPLVPVIALIMTPVEILGKLTKPFALAIRLFANMTAGHVLLLAIISLIFLFGSYAIAIGPVVMAVALTFLEIFVGFLQAYIFALLTSVFIGLIRHPH
jgi:F-type H+-transporting ATPase subunit a